MTHIHQIYIKASAQAIWDAITDPAWNGRCGYHAILSQMLSAANWPSQRWALR